MPRRFWDAYPPTESIPLPKHEAAPNTFKKCATCRRVQYCSRHCQATAWKNGHRHLCPRIAKLAPPKPKKPAPPPPPPPGPGEREWRAQTGFIAPPSPDDANVVFHAGGGATK